jgi:hypothetical protein
MSSIVAGKDGHVSLVLGAAGDHDVTSVFLELSMLVDFPSLGMTNAPRFHQQGQPDVVPSKDGLTDDSVRVWRRWATFKERHIADAEHRLVQRRATAPPSCAATAASPRVLTRGKEREDSKTQRRKRQRQRGRNILLCSHSDAPLPLPPPCVKFQFSGPGVLE